VTLLINTFDKLWQLIATARCYLCGGECNILCASHGESKPLTWFC